MDAGDFIKFAHTTAYADRAAADRRARARHARHRRRSTPRRGSGSTGSTRRGTRTTGRCCCRSASARATPPARSTATTTSGGCRSSTTRSRAPRNRYLRRRPVFRANAPGDAAAAEPRRPDRGGVRARRPARRARRNPARGRRELETAAALLAAAKTTDVTEDDVVTALPHAFYPESSWRDDLELAARRAARRARSELRAIRAMPLWRDAALGFARARRGHAQPLRRRARSRMLELVARRRATPAPLVADVRRGCADRAHRRAKRDPFRAAVTYDDFDAAPHAFGLAATVGLYRRLTGDRRYDALGTAQRNWAFGANAWGASLMIGVGSRFPRCPQHVVANLNGTRHRILARRRGQRAERPHAVRRRARRVLRRGPHVPARARPLPRLQRPRQPLRRRRALVADRRAGDRLHRRRGAGVGAHARARATSASGIGRPTWKPWA